MMNMLCCSVMICRLLGSVSGGCMYVRLSWLVLSWFVMLFIGILCRFSLMCG